MDKLEIRKYKEGEYENYLFKIEKENMKHHVDRFFEGGWIDDKAKEDFYRLLKSTHTYTMFFEGEIIGFFMFTKLENEPVIFIKNFQVKKEFQGKGAGSKALEFMEEKAKELGCKSIELAVFEENPAIEFYKKKGFTKSKIKAKNKHSVLMEKPL